MQHTDPLRKEIDRLNALIDEICELIDVGDMKELHYILMVEIEGREEDEQTAT